jgi:hypothetical protein
MAFELKNVVPWGRNLEEYVNMFHLTADDMNKSIISFGDGPASFNSEMRSLHKKIISLDPIYQFSKAEIHQRIMETKTTIIEQTQKNFENFVWKNIKDLQNLEKIRMDAMNLFLQDFDLGKKVDRYIAHQLPNKTTFDDLSFDLGLSSHFLLLYSQLGLDFHLASIKEMLRVCKEVRIFPLVNLNSEPSELLNKVIDHFQKEYVPTIENVNYEFQKGGNEMLRITRI